MGRIRVMSAKGDTATVWPDSAEERESATGLDETLVAESVFREAMERPGHLAYRKDDKNAPGEQIREFAPDAKEIVITPPLAGGC